MKINFSFYECNNICVFFTLTIKLFSLFDESGIHVSVLALRLCSTQQDRFRRGMVRVVVMGVSGCGKSTVGAALATALGLQFCDGDDWHSAANKEKMAAGRPLTDQDRAGWLAALSRLLADTHCVLACSALKLAYRSVCIKSCYLRYLLRAGRSWQGRCGAGGGWCSSTWRGSAKSWSGACCFAPSTTSLQGCWTASWTAWSRPSCGRAGTSTASSQ